uniref:Sodium/calcium exchanger membrane region domain-containing protein n=1 Tax=Ciona savignyi TaxID=51511 RepID=H2Y6Q1_CIOSA
NASLWCKFIRTTDNCQMDEGLINYLDVAFCTFKPKLLPLISVIYGLWLIFLFIGLGTTAEGFFCPSLEYIAHNLRLTTHGLTVVAFGNGSPDIFSAIAAFTNSNPTASGVAVGALLGAATFVTTVVAGLVATTQSFTLAQRPFIRDMTFFIAAAFWAFCLLYSNEITIYSSVGFLGLYFVYVTIVIVGRYIHQKQRSKLRKILGDPSNDSKPGVPSINGTADENSPLIDAIQSTLHTFLHGIQPINRDEWTNSRHVFKLLLILQAPWNVVCKLTIPIIILSAPLRGWNRPLNSISLLVAPIFCLFATKGEVETCGSILLNGTFPLWALMLLIGTVMSSISWLQSKNDSPPRYHGIFAYVGFIVAVVWTYTVANEIVNLLQTFGAILNVSNVIMGLTFLAWGNSIGDVVADVALARQGFPRMSLSACFGGPLFNLLIGIGLPCTITIIKTGKPVQVRWVVWCTVLCAGLLVSLCLSFIVIPLRKFQMTPAYGCVLVAVYCVFLIISLLTGLNVI